MLALLKGFDGERTLLAVLMVLLVTLPEEGRAQRASVQRVPAAVLLVEVTTNDEVEALNVTYRQVRARTKDILQKGLFWDTRTIEFRRSSRERGSFRLPLGETPRAARGQVLKLAAVVPQNLPTWRSTNTDVELFGDCVVVAVGGREMAFPINSPPDSDSERRVFDDVEGTYRTDVEFSPDDQLVQEFQDECGAPSGGPRAGSGVAATVSSFPVRGQRILDEPPLSPFASPPSYADDRFVVVEVGDLGEEGDRSRESLRAHRACEKVSPEPPLFACTADVLKEKTEDFAGLDGRIVWLDGRGRAFGAAARRWRDAPFGALVSEPLPSSKFDIEPAGLSVADFDFIYDDGQLSFSLNVESGGGRTGLIQLPVLEWPDSEWPDRVSVEAKRDSLGLFSPVLEITSRGVLALKLANPRPWLHYSGREGFERPAVGGPECDGLLPPAGGCDVFHEDLRRWASGDVGFIEATPLFGRASRLRPRVSADRTRIEIDPDEVSWLQFRLDVSKEENGSFEPAAGWTLRRTDEDGFRGDGLPLGPGGTVDSYRVARELLGARERATLAAHPDASRFFGYLPVEVAVARAELGGPGDVFYSAVLEPERIELAPSLLRRFAPALEIERGDGSVVTLIGEVDRFDARPDRIRDGGRYLERSRVTLEVRRIVSMRPVGLGAPRVPLTDRTALQNIVDALKERDETVRCSLLQREFGASSRDGVDLYVAYGQAVVLRWYDGSRYHLSVPALSDSSSVFRSVPEVVRSNLEIWDAGEWRPFEDHHACQAPPVPRSATTAYFLVVSEEFRQGGGTGAGGGCHEDLRRLGLCNDAAVTNRAGGDDVVAFREHWSAHADTLRDILDRRGFNRAELVAVSANREGLPEFEEVAGVRSLQDATRRTMIAFRSLYEDLPTDTMRAGSANRLLDPRALALRRAFLDWMPEGFDPFGMLFILKAPRGPAGSSVVGPYAVAGVRVITGYLGAARDLPGLVDEVLSNGGGVR